MVRKQVYIEEKHQRLLQRLSQQLGVTESALIRQGIERLELRSGVDRVDRSAWRELRRIIARLDRKRTGAQPASWSRDEMHVR